MKKQAIKISHIPAILWGNSSDRLFIAVHGNMSNKEDDVIRLLAEKMVPIGYQVLSFDLPQHGERKDETTLCKVQICVEELKLVINYAKSIAKDISLFACSMGAYFSLLAYKDEPIKQVVFLSPVVDMKRIIDNMMKWFQVTKEQLEQKQEIATPIGQTLYWDYYCYVKDNPIVKWNFNTSILYGLKDELCEKDYILDFSHKFQCSLEIMEDGEHYFHTEKQLAYFLNWIDRLSAKYDQIYK